MRHSLFLTLLGLAFVSCQEHQEQRKQPGQPTFETVDTDFSKGRLGHFQSHQLSDLEKFHGHRCDGLVLGALALEQGLAQLYPNQAIDRTNLRCVSKPSPCLTDVAIYLTGGRYQFNTFYVDSEFEGLFIVQRIDNQKTVAIALNEGVKPSAIDSLGKLAVEGKLSPCGIDSLKKKEDDFSAFLLGANPEDLFTVSTLHDFRWSPQSKHDYPKTDILNKHLAPCQDSGDGNR